MFRVRLFIAWLILAALPLQGFAAAGMLYCGDVGVSVVDGAGAHDHGMHDRAGMADAQAAATVAGDADGQATPLPGSLHTCSVCASCCAGLGLVAASVPAVLPSLPQAEPASLFARVHARPSPVPDKPPRA